MQTGLGGKVDYGSVFTGGVIELHEGDYISLKTIYPSSLWVSRAHTASLELTKSGHTLTSVHKALSLTP